MNTWYPGYMKKYNDYFVKNQDKYDVIITLADARAPIATLDFDIFKKFPNHTHILVLTKSDLADKRELNLFLNYFNQSKKIPTISLDLSKSLSKGTINKLFDLIIKTYQKNNLKIPLIYTILVMGFPNIGKSTLINRLYRKNIVQAANKPGVTKRPQLLKINEKFYIFDFPGITIKKFSDSKQWIIANLVNTLSHKVAEISSINQFAFSYLFENYRKVLTKIFACNRFEETITYLEFLNQVKAQKHFSSLEATEVYIFNSFKAIKEPITWEKINLNS
ncbi:YlqF/YawG GTPase family protein [Mycoplasma sp. SG1]|uniref:YlqF/YawG GTPase family protein n=1 Tax=Mycoplasma sp. SG1 TaxID=2810348 RepID=UPI00202568D7|nr:YlqF/YawG GTPase family protein [Mycoplasma sp. SG1]URM53210.1 50S ribosome-binding GTPase [Mycoplasma sp. SG1]